MLGLKTRRFIAISFIALFVVAAPLLILYTAGYRYNVKKQAVSRTGSMVIETEPKNATVSLSNVDEEYTTPLRLTDVFPNQYDITVTKDGYYSWHKQLTVESQLTTFAEDIILFKQSEPEQLMSEPVTAMYTADNKDEAILVLEDTEGMQSLMHYTFEDREATPLPLTLTETQEVDTITWAPSNDFVLLTLRDEEETTYTLAAISAGPELVEYALLETATMVRWDETQSNTLLLLDSNALFSAAIAADWKTANSPVQLTDLLVFEEDQTVIDAVIHNNIAYVIDQRSQSVILRKEKLEGNTPGELTAQIELDHTNNYTIEGIIDNKIVLRDLDRSKFYLINLELNNVLIEKTDVVMFDHFTKDNRLLLTTDTEITITDLKSYPFTFETVTRVSGGISHAQWYPVPNYVFFTKDQKMSLIELDNRDVKNVVTLPHEGVSHATLNDKGTFLYYISHETPGLYELEIAD
jgi:hypothetical protein